MNRLLKIGVFSAVLLGTNCSRRPSSIFEAVFKEIPRSVQVLQGQDQYFLDCCLWLHFKIDRKDLKKILDSGYHPETRYFDKWKQGMPPGMPWWKPELLGDSALYFEKNSEKEIEGLFTNIGMTEAYYVNYLK